VHQVRLLDEDAMEERAMAVMDPALVETRAAFDGVAATYDRSNDENPTLVAMRRRTMDAVRRYVPDGAHILDLGCGPGRDDEDLARGGYSVTAVDWSPAMVAETGARIRRAGLADRVQVKHLGIQEIEKLAPLRFDAACSDLGPLNCVPQLPHAARLIANRLKPGGILVASVIGRVCPWELALYAGRRDWPRMRVRFTRGFAAVPLDGRTVWTRYYSPSGFLRVFAQAGFRRVSLRALGLFMPPPYMDAFASRHPALMAVLQQCDDRFGALPGLRAMGDHFLVVLRKA
jgi:SAM-dependent methyltransferase